jgi:SAM-dependent MidA family methyltransferase
MLTIVKVAKNGYFYPGANRLYRLFMPGPLAIKIKQEIYRQGPISFARFMELALYTPGLGYYIADWPKFGRAGDFITAPEISTLYSYSIAKQCQQVFESMPGDVLEFGAGTGMMAAQILQELEEKANLPHCYYIMEISSDLRARQKQTLQKHVPHLLSKVKWLNTLNNFQLKGVIIANEVLDAFPVHRFKFTKGRLQEYFVSLEADEFVLVLSDPLREVKDYIDAIKLPYQEGYESECNLLLLDWVKTISEILTKGLCLLIDYGFPRHEYYHPDRNTGTLMCHYRHQAHDNPLINIGKQDITAHIDFTAIAEAATHYNLLLSGFTNQASFLISCGMIEAVQNKPKSGQEYWNLVNEIKLLTSPNEMGELFKVMALTKELDYSLLGFRERNICEKL